MRNLRMPTLILVEAAAAAVVVVVVALLLLRVSTEHVDEFRGGAIAVLACDGFIVWGDGLNGRNE